MEEGWNVKLTEVVGTEIVDGKSLAWVVEATGWGGVSDEWIGDGEQELMGGGWDEYGGYEMRFLIAGAEDAEGEWLGIRVNEEWGHRIEGWDFEVGGDPVAEWEHEPSKQHQEDMVQRWGTARRRDVLEGTLADGAKEFGEGKDGIEGECEVGGIGLKGNAPVGFGADLLLGGGSFEVFEVEDECVDGGEFWGGGEFGKMGIDEFEVNEKEIEENAEADGCVVDEAFFDGWCGGGRRGGSKLTKLVRVDFGERLAEEVGNLLRFRAMEDEGWGAWAEWRSVDGGDGRKERTEEGKGCQHMAMDGGRLGNPLSPSTIIPACRVIDLIQKKTFQIWEF